MTATIKKPQINPAKFLDTHHVEGLQRSRKRHKEAAKAYNKMQEDNLQYDNRTYFAFIDTRDSLKTYLDEAILHIETSVRLMPRDVHKNRITEARASVGVLATELLQLLDN